ncbi:DnaJ domain containing protein [Amanita muscaria]
MSDFPDYYKLLNVSKTVSQDEIRQAYKRESLKTHPDKLAKVSVEERKIATEKFQAIADAYYVLSDPKRRREYDLLYNARTKRTDAPGASRNFFAQFASTFGASTSAADTQPENAQPDPNGIFADVFDELLRPEVERHAPWWSWIGTACGGGLGFVVANVPGMMLGAYAGNRLGAIRDAKGKSVAAVFTELGSVQKAEVLRALALKVFGSTGMNMGM